MTDAAEDDIDEEIVAKVSDFIDGALKGAERDEVANKIDTDPDWKSVHDEMQEARKAISGMRKARAPAAFTDDFERNVNKMSGGRFFGRRRLAFGVFLAIAIIALAVVGYFMWSSDTGSLKAQKRPEPPKTQPQVTIPP
jgi:anti-sigma factor RsiW